MFIYILDSFVYTLLFPLSLNNSFINFNRDHGSLEYLLCKMKTYYIYIYMHLLFSTLFQLVDQIVVGKVGEEDRVIAVLLKPITRQIQ